VAAIEPLSLTPCNTGLAQIQGTIYWMSRALIAERELEDLRDSLKAKRN
jgi:hypothetical protein